MHCKADPLEALRALVFAGIKRALEIDGCCKAYEGAITVRYPSYFANQGRGILYAPQDCYEVELACYVLGPNRGEKWQGATLAEALEKATADVTRWIAEMEAQHLEDTGQPVVPARARASDETIDPTTEEV